MSRSPHPPSAGGRIADLWRRARLTLRYHGSRELAVRLVTFPLRGTRFARRIGHGRRYGPATARARRWYAEERRVVTVIVHGSGGRIPRGLRRATRASRTRIVAVEDGFAAAVRHGSRLQEDFVLLSGDARAERGWLERLQYAAYQSAAIGVTGPKLLDSQERIVSAGVHLDAAAGGELGHRYAGRKAALAEANIIAPVIGLDAACLYVKRDALGDQPESAVELCLRGWEGGRRAYYVPFATVRVDSAEAPRSPVTRDFFGARGVRTSDGGLRVVYVTEDTGVGGGHRDIFEHLNRLADRGHEVELFSLGEQPSWFDLRVPTRTFRTYETLLDALEPLDAIKVATWWNTAAPVWLASVRRGIPVFFVQDIETSYYPDSADMRSHVLAAYRPEFHYMTISGWNRDRLRELRLETALVPPGLDVETFHPLPAVERRHDMLLALGRTNPLKNLPLTLDAWRSLGSPDTRPELCLFGIEPELGPQHGVRYVERPSDAGVNQLLNEATVFVQTSTHEGFCLPPLEAMATGAAVVCTDAHGNRDFCVDGVNCLMPEPTAEAVAGSVRTLLDDAGLRERLGQAGRETAAQYAWDRRIDELEAFLEGVAERRSAALRV